MLHLDAQWLNALKQEFTARENTKLAPEQVVLTRDAGVYARFCRLSDLLFSSVSVPEKENALIEFIGDCDTDNIDGEKIFAFPAKPAPAAHAARKLRQVMAFLHQDCATMHPLAALADIAGMSRYQLIRAFRVSTGMTPHAYQLNLRINQARRSLRAGEDIADIAYRLGFSDQSHFQRVFKLHAGVTPGCYRA